MAHTSQKTLLEMLTVRQGDTLMPHKIKLPPFTFLVGPHGAGKTKLAELLCGNDPWLAFCSFDEPIRETVLATFFPDQMHIGIDLREEDILKMQLPLTTHTIGSFMTAYRAMLRSIQPSLIGDLAKKRVLGILGKSFNRAVFDDLDRPEDLSPFVLAHGAQNCRLIFVERSGLGCTKELSRFSTTFVPKTLVTNLEGRPDHMLERLAQMLPSDEPELPPSWEMSKEPPETRIEDL